MHIVFVTRELATANNSSRGLASFTANIARIFAANGHEVTILIVTSRKENYIFDENIRLESAYVKKKIWNCFDKAAKMLAFRRPNKYIEIRKFLVNLYKSKLTKKEIKKINNRKKIDIIHYCNWDGLAFRAGRNIPYVVRLTALPNVLRAASLPDTDIKYEDAELSINDRLLNYPIEYPKNKARYIISPSNLIADIVKRKFGVEATVIESPFLLSRKDWDYSLYASLVEGKKYIIHYGSLTYIKGTYLVAQIVQEFLQTYPDMYLVLAGNSEELLDEEGRHIKADKYVKKCAGKFGGRVVYAGQLVREQLYPLIQNAELCLLPYRMENLSNACIEAMAMGKIVIGTNGASFEQLIDDRVSGFLCERDNPVSYMQAVKEALEMSDSEKELMISRAVARIKLLSSDVIYEKFLAYYQKVIAEWEK